MAENPETAMYELPLSRIKELMAERDEAVARAEALEARCNELDVATANAELRTVQAVARAERAEQERDESDRQWRVELERFKAALYRAERAEALLERLTEAIQQIAHGPQDYLEATEIARAALAASDATLPDA